MCCRYYYEDQIREMMEDLRASQTIKLAEPLQVEPGRDIHPSDSSVVICREGDDLYAKNMRWGFDNPYAKGLIINARAETAMEKNLFSDSILNRRCVSPASGFYEWDPYKARYQFTSPEGGLLLLAGFYRSEQGVPRFTILTTDANDSMIKVHNRMPVMIGRDEIRPWIEDDERLPDFLSRPQVSLACEQDSGQISFLFGDDYNFMDQDLRG